ncbi:MAG: hypothetical protein U1E64_01545 [Sphingomonadaceae bacterium]
MSHRFLITGLSLLVACSTGQPNNELVIDTKDGPSSELVAKIENKLSSDPCLSKIEVMRREYRFASRDGKVERGLIDINVQEAGIDGLPSGRFVVGPQTSMSIDDRPYFVAFATYVVSSDALDLWACGRNTAASIRHDRLY